MNDQDPERTAELSTPRLIRTRVLNMTIGQWMRAIDLVLANYQPSGRSVEEDADQVTRLAVFVMLKRWYDDDVICLLMNSSTLRLPRRLTQTSRFEVAKILDKPPSGSGEIDNCDPEDDDAPPGPDGFSLPLPPIDALPRSED